MAPRFYGPFSIKDKLGPNTYRLRESDRLVSVRRLRRFKYSENAKDVDWTGLEWDDNFEEEALM